MAYLILFICIIVPGVVLTVHFRKPENKVTQFLLPKFLQNRDYPKSIFRQAGTGWLVFSVWLLTTALSIPNALPKSLVDGNLILMGISGFAAPIIAVMSFIIGLYYLIVGIFARAKKVTPGFQSMFASDNRQLDLYMKRLMKYTVINISSLVLVIAIPLTEAALGVEPAGIVVLINVAFLITFIMTVWRVRDYLVKSAKAMGQSGEKILAATLGNPLAFLFAWYFAFNLKKKYENLRNQPPPNKPTPSKTPY